MKETWFPGKLAVLGKQECLELLARTSVGRVAWCDPMGPVIVPVNYVLDNETILFRTSPRTALAEQLDLGWVTFQIDEYDEYTQSGWSVMARGRANYLNSHAAAEHGVQPEPWASGDRNFNVGITAVMITGRRIIPT